MGTFGGDTYTEAEMKSWMEQIGIFFTERIELGRGNDLMIGTKK